MKNKKIKLLEILFLTIGVGIISSFCGFGMFSWYQVLGWNLSFSLMAGLFTSSLVSFIFVLGAVGIMILTKEVKKIKDKK